MNKIIWTYWHQGFEDAPQVVKPCVEQWKYLNPDWEVRFIDQDNMYDFIDPPDINKETLDQIPLAVSSDLFKLQLLIKYGGVWVDATTFPIVPLDEWLIDKMDAGYFFFYKPGRDRLISSWFIASEKNNLTLKLLYENLIKYWNTNTFKNLSNPRSARVIFLSKFVNRNLFLTKLWFSPLFTNILRVTPYFVTHYMFYKVISNNKGLRHNFQLMPKFLADPSHSFKNDILMEPLRIDLKELVDNRKVPVIKLSRSAVEKNIPSNSNLSYLFNQKKKR
jgi:hypothetical protein